MKRTLGQFEHDDENTNSYKVIDKESLFEKEILPIKDVLFKIFSFLTIHDLHVFKLVNHTNHNVVHIYAKQANLGIFMKYGFRFFGENPHQLSVIDINHETNCCVEYLKQVPLEENEIRGAIAMWEFKNGLVFLQDIINKLKVGLDIELIPLSLNLEIIMRSKFLENAQTFTPTYPKGILEVYDSMFIMSLANPIFSKSIEVLKTHKYRQIFLSTNSNHEKIIYGIAFLEHYITSLPLIILQKIN